MSCYVCLGVLDYETVPQYAVFRLLHSIPPNDHLFLSPDSFILRCARQTHPHNRFHSISCFVTLDSVDDIFRRL